ncbi:MAG: DUF2278 family protein [Pseudomonadota bacterium]
MCGHLDDSPARRAHARGEHRRSAGWRVAREAQVSPTTTAPSGIGWRPLARATSPPGDRRARGETVIDKRFASGANPHYQVHIVDDTTDYRIAVNVQSKDGSQVEYVVQPWFDHRILEGLHELPLGFKSLAGSGPGGLALDYIRGNLLDRTKLVPLPFSAPPCVRPATPFAHARWDDVGSRREVAGCAGPFRGTDWRCAPAARRPARGNESLLRRTRRPSPRPYPEELRSRLVAALAANDLRK